MSDENTISCEVCDEVFCPPCTKLVPTELRVLQLKSPTTLIFCCQSCRVNLKTPKAITVRFLKDQLKLLMDTVQDKDTIIEDKKRIIAHLEDNLSKLTLPVQQDVTKNKNKGNRANASASIVPDASSSLATKGGTSSGVTRPGTLRAMEVKQRNVMNELINLAGTEFGPKASHARHIAQPPEIADSAGAKWKTVTHKRKKNHTTLGANTGELSIAAVESRRSIFVSRLSPDTTSEKLQQYLVGVNIKPLNIEKLDIRSKEIAAFKVVVQQSDEKRTIDGELWPKYTIIRPFRQPRSFLNGQSQPNQVS